MVGVDDHFPVQLLADTKPVERHRFAGEVILAWHLGALFCTHTTGSPTTLGSPGLETDAESSSAPAIRKVSFQMNPCLGRLMSMGRRLYRAVRTTNLPHVYWPARGDIGRFL